MKFPVPAKNAYRGNHEFQVGQYLVALHDSEGFPLELSLEIVKERMDLGEEDIVRPALAGIVIEAAERRWPPKRIMALFGQYEKLFGLTDLEAKMVYCMRTHEEMYDPVTCERRDRNELLAMRPRTQPCHAG